MLTPDQRLLESITRRDAAAFAEFYDRHAPRVFGLLVRLLGSRADAEEVLQETFWQIWRTAERYDATRSRPEVWLLTIARSRAMDCLRRRGRAIESAPESRPPDADPCDVLLRQEAHNQLRGALAALPEDQRTPIVLAFFEGWTHVQIAGQLGIPL